MERKMIEDKIRKIIEKKFGKSDVESNLQFMDGIDGWDLDSLEFVRLIVFVEECFDIVIDFDEEFHTMTELVEIVQKKLRKEDE